MICREIETGKDRITPFGGVLVASFFESVTLTPSDAVYILKENPEMIAEYLRHLASRIIESK